MCGIAGFFDADASFLSNEEQYQILLAKMGRTLKHRGPDASGTLLCNRCGLAHRRLSIIDITGGAQPADVKNLFGLPLSHCIQW